MTSQVLEGAILAIGIAYVKVSPFLPEVRHTHTHTPSKVDSSAAGPADSRGSLAS